jgi:hypothetical protein
MLERIFKIVGIICIALSLIPLCLAIYFYIQTRRYLDSASFTLGLVMSQVESKETTSAGTGSLKQTVIRQRPLIKFQASDGEYREFVSKETYAENGENVTVLYPANDPAEARVYNFIDQWFSTMFTGFFFLCFFVVGAGFLLADWLFNRNIKNANHSSYNSRIKPRLPK